MGKTIVITGGSRGIGAAAAELAGRRGWSVAINYLGNEKAAKETAARVEAAGGKAITVKGDVAVVGDVASLFDSTEKAFGPIDGVLSNAGGVAPPLPLADMDPERIRHMIDLNLFSILIVAREAIRRMGTSRGGKGGVIVNVSSAAARLGGPGEYVDYAAAKGGVDAFTLGLAKEVGKEGIRVSAIRPGLIDTELHAAGGQPDRVKRLAHNVPVGRSGTAMEVAEAAVWLLSDEAVYVSGAILDVTGAR